MKNFRRMMLLAVAGAVAAGVDATGTTGWAQALPENATVYASGLEAPRGLAFGPDGSLYVAEAGAGGSVSTVGTCAQTPLPVGPYLGGTTGRISKVDGSGKVTTVATGFPSSLAHQGDLQGVADVVFLDGSLYALLAGGGCSHGNSTLPNGVAKVNTKTGKWTYVTDLSVALLDFPAKYTAAGDYEPDGVWYSMIAKDGLLYTVEPNHGQIFSVSPAGKVRQVIDVSASQGHIVPTSIVSVGDALYVGNLFYFPILQQWSRVITIAKDLFVANPLPGFDGADQNYARWKIVSSKAGFTAVVCLKVGPDGLLYALELSDAPGYPTPGAGKVVRVRRNGVIEEVVTGLTVPTAMTFGPDNALYISNLGAAPVGQVLRVTMPAAQ